MVRNVMEGSGIVRDDPGCLRKSEGFHNRCNHVALREKESFLNAISELAKESDLERVFLAGNLSELGHTWRQVYGRPKGLGHLLKGAKGHPKGAPSRSPSFPNCSTSLRPETLASDALRPVAACLCRAAARRTGADALASSSPP